MLLQLGATTTTTPTTTTTGRDDAMRELGKPKLPRGRAVALRELGKTKVQTKLPPRPVAAREPPAYSSAAMMLLTRTRAGEFELPQCLAALLDGRTVRGGGVNQRDEHGDTLLVIAVRMGWVTAVHALIAAGADVTSVHGATSQTLLHIAITSQYARIVEALCAAPLTPRCLHVVDIDGRTVLALAVIQRNAAWVERLLGLGAEAHAPFGELCTTPLNAAVLLRDATVVQLLLGYGASPFARDNPGLGRREGNTPLQNARIRHCGDIEQILLAQQAVAEPSSGGGGSSSSSDD